MNIRHQRPIGKFINPDTGRVNQVFTGMTKTRKSVRFTNPDGCPKIITPQQFVRWKRAPEIR